MRFKESLRGQRIREAEELFNFRDLQSSADARLNRYQQQAATILLAACVNTHESANAGRVNIRNTGKVQYQRF